LQLDNTINGSLANRICSMLHDHDMSMRSVQRSSELKAGFADVSDKMVQDVYPQPRCASAAFPDSQQQLQVVRACAPDLR
jgi:hypothetical protein